ncbi:VOC family protein [Hyphomonas johnsonii]|uniref:Glyoxalase family protein n=1 Tax=Hyphomonas johnsonii MHS-2 TaxID=1280950 RepID=A0A059FMI7_9PROT|nr:VOC family protein [Hyphomonas johnsonii]KCZ91822.1 glyoxalase family protein [Hyphomonas johnsonii MHS-2]
MITGLDHIVLVCPEIASATEAYVQLLGRAPDWQATGDGAATALFRVANTALELMGPDGEGPVADRLREILAADGPGLKSLAFRARDIEHAHHRLTRRGLKPQDIVPGESRNKADGQVRDWRRFRCDDAETAGVRTFLIEHLTGAPSPQPAPADAVGALDHIVINTPNPDRAAALYGARLGLDMALDRTAEQWKTRFLFFRTGNLTFEVIHRLGETHDPAGPDSIWGLTWLVEDLDAAHARLTAAGRDVSEARKGRKPGSRVFTVRDGTLGVPTLFISHQPE